MRTIFAGLVVLCSVGPLWADVGPAPWQKDLYHVVQVVNVEDWPDHVFFVFPLLNPNLPESSLRLNEAGEARFVLHGPTKALFGRPYLFAMERRGVPNSPPPIDPRTFREVKAGLYKSEEMLAEHEPLRLSLTEVNDTFVTRYRVEKAPDFRLKLTLVEEKMVPRGSLPGEEPVATTRWLFYSLGLAVIVVVIAIILWRARKVMVK
jgi:hypothetical protein